MSRALNNLSQCLLPDRSGARRKSREIDAMLKGDRRESLMILLTGRLGAGKSTVLRHMRLINGPAFNNKELLEFREAIYHNVVQGMKALVLERKKLGMPLQNSANEKHEMLFRSLAWHMKLEPSTFQPYVEAIDSLWKDSGIQEAHLRRSDLCMLYESAKYYFDNIQRIGKLNYLPHNQDVIRAPKGQSTLADEYFVLRESPFAFAKYYFPRSPKCWLSLIQIETPVLFIVGSSDSLCEDNCLVDSLQLFECLCNYKMFLNSTIIIFFNKMDLLAEKIQTSDIRKHFPEFQGDPHKLEDVQEFLVQSFQKRKGNNNGQLFYHMTTAVDTESFLKVFESVKDTLMSLILKNTSLL